MKLFLSFSFLLRGGGAEEEREKGREEPRAAEEFHSLFLIMGGATAHSFCSIPFTQPFIPFRHAHSPLGLLLIALLLLGRSAASFHSMKESKLASQKKATNLTRSLTSSLFFRGPTQQEKREEVGAKREL